MTNNQNSETPRNNPASPNTPASPAKRDEQNKPQTSPEQKTGSDKR